MSTTPAAATGELTPTAREILRRILDSPPPGVDYASYVAGASTMAIAMTRQSPSIPKPRRRQAHPDVSDLLPVGRRIAVALRLADRRVTWRALMTGLQRSGVTCSSARAQELRRVLSEDPEIGQEVAS